MKQIACTAAKGAEPIYAARARYRVSQRAFRQSRHSACRSTDRNVGFQSEHQLPELPIVAELSTPKRETHLTKGCALKRVRRAGSSAAEALHRDGRIRVGEPARARMQAAVGPAPG